MSSAPPIRAPPPARTSDARPPAEPSADLLVNLSRCRRLIVVLSDAFLSRAWCSHSFREGLCRLLELTRRPIFITFEGQRRDPAHPALRLLRQHRHLVTLLLWRPGSVVRSRRGGAGASGGLEMGGARAPGGDPSVGSSAAPHFLNGPWGEVPLPGTPMRGAALEGPGAAE